MDILNVKVIIDLVHNSNVKKDNIKIIGYKYFIHLNMFLKNNNNNNNNE